MSQLKRRGLGASDRRQRTGPGPVLLRRLALPGRAARRRPAADDRGGGAILEAARAVGLPVTTRGAGTSCAGNAVGPGLIMDTSRHLNRIIGIDAEARTARVEPGVVQASLQVAAAPHGLRFGPDPSTHTRCTIGGMIGNNACGPRALGYGKTADNVVALDVITGSGERLRAERRAAAPTTLRVSISSDPWSPPTWRPSGPSSAGSAGRSPATAWSTCCRSVSSTSPVSWPAPRARSR